MADYVNPIGPGLKSARIDMGVDYTGSGPLYALGSGTIRNVYNSGWPGGKFIDLLLDSGQYAGKHVFYAENITPRVTVGQHVNAGQLIGTAVGTYPFIEVGWASGVGGQTMAAKAGQQNKGGDPGKYSTAYGVSMSQLIQSLGGPGGITTPGGIRGVVSPDFPGATGSANTTASIGSTFPGCIPLIWVVYFAVCKTEKCGWHVSRSQRRHRKSPHEKRNRRGGRQTDQASTRD